MYSPPHLRRVMTTTVVKMRCGRGGVSPSISEVHAPSLAVRSLSRPALGKCTHTAVAARHMATVWRVHGVVPPARVYLLSACSPVLRLSPAVSDLLHCRTETQ